MMIEFLSILLLAQIKVGPTDDLQAALDASPPNAILLVVGNHPEVVVRKPVQLVGNPARISATSGVVPAVLLDGPGGGRVTLRSLVLGHGDVGPLHGQVQAPVAGGGFHELALLKVQARPPGYTGTLYMGASGLEVNVPNILLVNSEVSATNVVPYDSTCCLPNAPAGIDAPGARVWILRSLVQGGSGESCVMPWPCGFADPLGGRGGDGVIAAQVYRHSSRILPGAGVPWLGSDGTPCFKAESGQAIVIR